MIKILSVIVFLSSSIYAQNFDEFLNNALKQSPYLRATYLSTNQTALRGEVLGRYKNPELELEYSQFSPDVGSNESGYRVAFAQPLRVWGVGDEMDNLALSWHAKAKAQYLLSHAELTKKISLNFSEYRTYHELYALATEELSIAKRIYEISNARYEAGTISQGVMLQAKIDFESVEINLDSVGLALKKKYFQLLEIAGFSKEIELEYDYNFMIEDQLSTENNPELHFLDSSKSEALASANVNAHKIQFFNLLAEYENESNQDIYRVGVSIPLAVFNTKKQEREISRLEVQKLELIAKQQGSVIGLQMIELKQEREALKELQMKNKRTLRTLEKLLNMYEESYKIANINLLELQNIKNRVIKTKESLIKIKSAIDNNTINTNYITGAYNE